MGLNIIYEEMNFPLITDIENSKDISDKEKEDTIMYDINDFCEYFTYVFPSELLGTQRKIEDADVVDYLIYRWFQDVMYFRKNGKEYDDHIETMVIFGLLQDKISKFSKDICEDYKERDYQKMFKYILKFLNDHM